MYYLDSLKDYKLYQNKPFLFKVNDKDKFKDSFILVDSYSIDDTIEIINNSNVNDKYIKCYYVDKIAYSQVKTIKKKTTVNQANYYKKVKTSCKNIVKTYPTMDKYEGLSMYYDISPNNKLFFDNAVYSDKIKMNAYLTYLNTIYDNETIDKYPNKYVLCKVDNTSDNYDTFFSKLNNFLSMILNLAYYNETFSSLPNLTVIVLGKASGKYLKFTLQTLTKKKLNIMKRLLNIIFKLENGIALTDAEEQEIDVNDLDGDEELKDSEKEVVKEKVDIIMNPTTNQEKAVAMKIDSKIDNAESEQDLDADQEFLEYLEELKQEKITAGKAAKNTARNELLKAEQMKIKINNDKNSKTMEDILKETDDKIVKTNTLPVKTKNKEDLKISTLADFERSYNENLDYKDKLTILKSMSDDNREIKVYIRNIKKEDTSTAFTKKETWTIEMEDDRRVRHTVKVDFPIFIDDKFLYIEGNKKILNKQLMLLPIIKTKPDTVQIVTNSNSNKTFIKRFGSKISPKIEKFRKFLAESNGKYITTSIGNNFSSNQKYLTNIEYDELSNNYTFFKIGNTKIYFNQEIIREEYMSKGIKIPNSETVIPLGLINGKEPILYDMEKSIVYTSDNKKGTEIGIIDYIMSIVIQKNPSVQEIYDNIKIPKKYTYTRCNILNREISLLVFLAYNEGLSTILHKAKVNYELSDKRHVMSAEEKERRGVIVFKDKYLYYDIYPYSNSLLMNALLEIDTSEYEYEMFDSKEVYLEVFNDLYGSRAISKGFDNFYELFIDGITKEILEDLNYPTDITSLFLYANKLLEDNRFIKETDMSNYRIRSNEIVNVYLEKELNTAYNRYKNSVNGANPIKISIPQDKILKDLINGENLQDYNTLNPITEVDSVSTATYKGPGGLLEVWSTIKHFNFWNTLNQKRTYDYLCNERKVIG